MAAEWGSSDCWVCSLLLPAVIKAFPIWFWLPEGKLEFKKEKTAETLGCNIYVF